MRWYKFAVYFSFKSPSKFIFDLNLWWILLHNIWPNSFCLVWFLINTAINYWFFTKSQNFTLHLHTRKFCAILRLSWNTRKCKRCICPLQEDKIIPRISSNTSSYHHEVMTHLANKLSGRLGSWQVGSCLGLKCKVLTMWYYTKV